MIDYLHDSSGAPYSSDTFNLDYYLGGIDPEVLSTSMGRRELTKYDPLLFMLVYTPHIMSSPETGNVLSVNDTNLTVCRDALNWLKPHNQPKADGLRKALLAPRSSTKSSSAEMCVLWASAHGHIPYTVMFSGSDQQAVEHLQAITHETKTNALLQRDFPEFCHAKRDQSNSYKGANGTRIDAKSITSSTLGAKDTHVRPQLIICDDISRGEGTGSVYQSQQMLDVLEGTIFPLNDTAPVYYLCTNHFIGSIEDDLVKSLSNDAEQHTAKWVEEQNFSVNWLLPLVSREDGTLRSIWPERWSVSYLLSQQHTRSYQKDFMNLPVPLGSGEWFTQDDFRDPDFDLSTISKWCMSIDPGVSAQGDPTGVSIIGLSLSAKKAVIFEAMPLSLKSVALKKRILELLQAYPMIQDVVWEQNQGGQNLAYATLGEDFPARVHFIHQSKSKLERAEILLTRYRRLMVVHARKLPAYEAEALQLPAMPHSPNMIDAVGMGVEWIASRPTGPPPRSLSVSRRNL